ncbi:MAG: YCF48-related protein [Fibrobacteria bacterium]
MIVLLLGVAQTGVWAQRGFYASQVYFNAAGKGFVLGDSGRLYTAPSAAGPWSMQVLSRAKGVPDLHGVHFPTADVGYIVGSTTLLKTVDGGQTWTEPASTPFILGDVFFTSEKKGTATGLFVASYTEDGGMEWSNVSYSVTASNPTSFHDLVYFNDTDGVLVGNNGEILKTPGESIHPTPNDLKGVSFPTREVGYAVGENGTILKTTDGGVTWKPQASGSEEDFADVFFLNANLGWVVGGFSSPAIFKTADGGATWTEYKGSYGSFPYGSLNSVVFTDANTGFAVGINFFLTTTDGGVTWKTAPAPQLSLYRGNRPASLRQSMQDGDALGRMLPSSTRPDQARQRVIFAR